MKIFLVLASAVLACAVASTSLAASTGQYAGQTPQHAIASAQLSVVGLASAIGGKSDTNTVAALKKLVNKPGYTATKSMCGGKQAWAVRAPHLTPPQQGDFVKQILKLEPKLAAFTGTISNEISAPIMVTSGGAQLSCTL